jgi:ubiquinone/menaquinone biosynthesis C-methylase UbiE
MAAKNDTVFAGSVPQVYESHMVPLIFEPYAVDIAKRVAALKPKRVLEIAAGTGVVTRQLAVMLDASCEIVATDLNPAMIEEASRIPTARPIDWRVADAMKPGFEDASFDAVVCQFGVMFFPDRVHAYREMRRVLAPGGRFIFNAWDRIEANDFAAAAMDALAALFPQDPPRFMARTPHGYHDEAQIRSDVLAAGFKDLHREWIAFTSRATTADIAATGYCQGTPWRGEIEARDPTGLARVTKAVGEELARRFGDGPVEGQIRAVVVEAAR